MRDWSHTTMAATGAAYASALLGQPPLKILLDVTVAGGAGALCDLDTYGAAPSRAFGWGTGLLSHIVARISGGHRGMTHTQIGDLIFAGIASLALALTPVRVPLPHARHGLPALLPASFSLGSVILWLYLALLLGTAAKAFNWPRHDHRREALACAAATVIVWTGYDTAWLPAAILFGTMVHCLGDAVTKHGVAFFKPFTDHRFHMGLPEWARITTGKFVENCVIDPLIVIAAFVFAYWRITTFIPYLRGMN